MPTVKATDAAVDSKPLGSGAYLITESAKLDRLRGFMLICNPQSASFVLQRKLRQNGKKRTVRVKLGVRGEITVAEAHAKAVEALKTFNEGRNPNEQRQTDGRLTLQQTFDMYITEGRGAGTLRESTISRYDSHFRNHLKPWASRTMEELGRAKMEIIALNERLNEKNGWAAANGTIRLLSHLYNRATELEEGLLANPCRAVKLTKDKVRDTALGEPELKTFWSSVMKLSNPVKRAYWLMVALTGGRRTQIASARWDEVDFGPLTGPDAHKQGVWTFPDEHAKGGCGYPIPISEFMVKFLLEWRKYVQQEYPVEPQSLHIFPSFKTKEGHIKKPRNEKQGVEVTAHPLRHTWETARVGVGLGEIEALLLLGHTLKKSLMSHRYVTREKVDTVNLRARQEEMTAHLLKALGISEASIREIIWSDIPRSAWKQSGENKTCLPTKNRARIVPDVLGTGSDSGSGANTHRADS